MKLSCHVCLPLVALDHAAAIAYARPNKFIRLSLVGNDVPTRVSRMTRFRRLIRAIHVGWRDVYHVHANPRGTGHHVHLWSYGSTANEAEVSAVAVRSGMGREVHVQDAYLPAVPVPRLPYGMAAVIDRPDGAQTLWPAALEYLQVNGGRLLHATQQFWRDPQGRRISDPRAAATVAKSAHR